MRDKMQEPVCPKCGSDDGFYTDPGQKWDQWKCLSCWMVSVKPETRAEYLAALEDQNPGVDR